MASGQLQEIKDRLDIAEVLSCYIRLTKAGRNFKALCPFHNEKSPSFIISPDRQIWHCFGCGEGGDIFTFVMKIEGMEFSEALQMLAERAGVELERFNPAVQKERASKKTNILAVCHAAKNFYKDRLSKTPTGLSAKKYLLGRGLSEGSISAFEIGYSPDDWHATENFLKENGFSADDISAAGFTVKSETKGAFHDRFRGRIMFPILDISSRAIGFGGRTFAHQAEEEAKYINTPDSAVYNKSRVLYGLNFARGEIRKKDSCILVEGYMDVIGSHQMGVKNAVSSSGTALTVDQIRVIKRYAANLTLAFDGDLAGQEATSRSIDLAIQAGMNVKVIVLPVEKDPSDYVAAPDDWKGKVKTAKRVIDFYFENSFAKNDPKSIEGKRAIAEELLAEIKKIPSGVERAHWIGILAEKLGIEEKILVEEMKKNKVEKRTRGRDFKEEKSFPAAKSSPEQKWEEQLLALVAISPRPREKIQKISAAGFGFTGRDFQEIFKFFSDAAGQNAEENLTAEAKKSLSPELFQKLSEMILEIEYRQNLEAGEEDEAEWRDKIFYAALTRSIIRQYENKKKGLEADIKLAEKNKDYASRDLLAAEFAKIAGEVEEIKKRGFENSDRQF